MDICIITGSAGLIGREATEFFSKKFDLIIGLDNDMRADLFGSEASTKLNKLSLIERIKNYVHYDIDICDKERVNEIFKKYNRDIKLIIHTAAQPSHDWAASDPFKDFNINALGTLNLLENCRNECPDVCFIFTSTNKVYGDTPNLLPLIEHDTRWELDSTHKFHALGIDETMSIDGSKHSLFGASKLSADIYVQEYAKYFGMKTGVFRGGCLTGPNHAVTQLHGFLSYLVKCAAQNLPYTIFGYKGKQVRDNIFASDLINMFWHFYTNPVIGQVFNCGGGRKANCSMLEAIKICQEITGREMLITYSDQARSGDHIWWISDTSKFQQLYPDWEIKYNIDDTIYEIFNKQ